MARQFTSGRENPWDELDDIADGPSIFEALAEALDDAPRVAQGTAAAKTSPSSGKVVYYATDEDALYYWDGTTWRGPWKRIGTTAQGRSFTMVDDTAVPTSGLPLKLGRFWVPIATGQVTKLVSAYHKLETGTSVSWKLQRATGGGAWADISGWGTTATPIVTSSGGTAQGSTLNPGDVTLSDGDVLGLVILAVSGSAAGFSVQVNLEDS